MPKQIIVENYQSAYNIMFGKWLRIDPCDDYEKDEDSFPLYTKEISPIDLILKEEAWKELSGEAREMISVVLQSPVEILDLISTPTSKKITKGSIRRYFNNIWNSKFITDLVIKEIADWVNKL